MDAYGMGAALNNLPPRYAIESDSEDSDFEDPDELSEAPKVVRASKASTSREPGLAFSAALPKGNALILAIDRAGEIWSKGLQAFDELAALTVDGEQIASLSEVDCGLLLCCSASHLALSQLRPVAEVILDQLQPRSIQVIDAFSAESYLSPLPDVQPVICHLQSSDYPATSLPKLEIPNMHQGLSVAVMLAAFARSTPAQLLLLPSSGADRPQGIYDPTPAPSDSFVLQALQQAPSSELKWPKAWGFDRIIASKSSLWAWKRRQDKQRVKAARQQAATENMYM